MLPEQWYNMEAPHPPSPPFLRSMYWTEAGRDAGLIRKRLRPQGEGNLPSLITNSPMESPTRFGIQESDDGRCARHRFRPSLSPPPRCGRAGNGPTWMRAHKLLVPLNSMGE